MLLSVEQCFCTSEVFVCWCTSVSTRVMLVFVCTVLSQGPVCLSEHQTALQLPAVLNFDQQPPALTAINQQRTAGCHLWTDNVCLAMKTCRNMTAEQRRCVIDGVSWFPSVAQAVCVCVMDRTFMRLNWAVASVSPLRNNLTKVSCFTNRVFTNYIVNEC